MPQAFFGPALVLLDVWHVKTTKVLELDALEQIPDAFLWIEIRRIGRQLFEMNAIVPSFTQIVFDCLTTVYGSPIPDHQQIPNNHCSLAHAECSSDVFLFPSLFMLFPGAHPSSFAPILWRGRFLVQTSFHQHFVFVLYLFRLNSIKTGE